MVGEIQRLKAETDLPLRIGKMASADLESERPLGVIELRLGWLGGQPQCLGPTLGR
jgi:hypothetical protein